MEKISNSTRDQNNLSVQSEKEDIPSIIENVIIAAESSPDDLVCEEQRRRKRHEDHHVSRKYKMFSNHSSANDMPHTNTSF